MQVLIYSKYIYSLKLHLQIVQSFTFFGRKMFVIEKHIPPLSSVVIKTPHHYYICPLSHRSQMIGLTGGNLIHVFTTLIVLEIMY